jgi:hypothetical protein
MPRISTEEFERLPLRVHDFLAGVPLHDVWAVDLPQVRAGITLNEFLNSAREPLRCSLAVRALVNVRFALGRVFGWDRKLGAQDLETFASRLTTSDRARTLTSPGKPEGIFRIVYRFENEQLLEIINRTAHAGAQCPRREGRGLPLLLWRVRTSGRPIHAGLHGSDRPVAHRGGLSFTPSLNPSEVV